MKHTVEFKIKANLIDCYLYAGYLFLIMTNGRITYVSYHRVLHILAHPTNPVGRMYGC